MIDHNHTVPVLDGGCCSVGVESTILDLSIQPPSIRRLGAIVKEDLSDFIKIFGHSMTPTSGTIKAHYAPSTSLLLSNNLADDIARLKAQGLTVRSSIGR